MDEKREKARSIVTALKDRGFTAYLVGGCVRDMIMERSVEDYDIATSALPHQIRSLFSRTIPVGEQFGVIIVVMDGVPFEVATFRKDDVYRDGRHPVSVEFSGEREDAMRRDFTINGLFYDPVSETIVDYVDGRQDIDRGIIRTIGDPYQRFSEDKLRLLRAVRFACQLDFSITSGTWKAIKDCAHRVKEVSAERIRDEVVKILTGEHPGTGLDLLDTSGILQVILPEVSAMKGVEQPAEFHPEGDVFLHTKMMLDLLDHPSEELAMAVLFHDIGKPNTFQVKDRIRFNGHDIVGAAMARHIMTRLKFPRKLIETVSEMVKSHMQFINVREMRESTLKRFLNRDSFGKQLELHRIDCMASHKDISNWEFCSQKLDSYREEELAPPPLLRGQDLISLGYEPGPVFSKILRFVEDAQLEGRITDRDEAIRLVQGEFPLKETDG